MNQPNRRRRKKKQNLSAYYMVVTLVGVIAISTASYGIFKVLSSGDAITTGKPSDKNSSQSQSKPIDDDNSDTADIGATSTVKVLTGDNLENILFERTGVSATESNTIPSGGNAGGTGNTDTTENSSSAPASSTVTPPPQPKYTAKNTPETIGTSGFANIASWKSKNSDVIGWLKIPNTNIDFPVVVGPDNLYYNALDYNKAPSKNGVIWADSDTKFGTRSQISKNTVIYGHNWTNVSANPRIGTATDVMFGQLPSFHYLDFAKNTPYIYYSTTGEEMVWQVFAVFYTEDSFNYITSDGDAAYMSNLISEAKSRSLHNFNVNVSSSDKVLTLSTCTRAYGSTDKQRYVVMAKLMGKDEKIQPVTVTANPNFKRPKL